MASKPARIGDTCATEAAAKAASATGGVMKLSMPQYITNIWLARGSSPEFVNAGTNTMARKIYAAVTVIPIPKIKLVSAAPKRHANLD